MSNEHGADEMEARTALSRVSHALRSPLNVVNGYSQLLSRLALPDEALEYVATIQQGVGRMVQILDELRDGSVARVSALERIWNGWRSQYVNESGTRIADGEGSVFTQILRSGLADEETHVLHRGQHVFAILNAFPYTSGHLMVVPYREVGDLEELTEDEADELWPTVTVAVRAVKAAYRPGGVNVGINLGRAAGGSISEHLHVHVVPRWAGDGNFMTAVAEARTLPEPLSFSAQKLRAVWGS